MIILAVCRILAAMSKKQANPLAEYLKANDLTYQEFGDLIEQTPQSVHQYATGKRIPRPDTMTRIGKVTKGAVTIGGLYAAA